VDESGSALNGGAEMLLDGSLLVGHVRVLEIRKLNGNVRVLRMSVPASDASRCSAVVAPLVRRGDEWVRSGTRPVLVPLTSLGRRVDVSASEMTADGLSVAEADERAGGPRLRPLTVSSEDFGAEMMLVVSKALMAMTVDDLKTELEARNELKSGNKAWLRRRLHAAILRARL
jgi:hypothetical protein